MTAKQKESVLTEVERQARILNWNSSVNEYLRENSIDLSYDLKELAFDLALRSQTAPVMESGGWPGRAEIEAAHEKYKAIITILFP